MLILLHVSDASDKDTWIFPLIQMGEFNITQDEKATCGILSSSPKGSYFRLATGYFNLTNTYADVLLRDCKAHISLLMAHPNVSIVMKNYETLQNRHRLYTCECNF